VTSTVRRTQPRRIWTTCCGYQAEFFWSGREARQVSYNLAVCRDLFVPISARGHSQPGDRGEALLAEFNKPRSIAELSMVGQLRNC